MPDFWANADVRTALLNLVSHPGIARPEEHAQIAVHFDAVLPERRNRERVNRAISYLLRLVAEEVWSVPGAREIREIASLQMQRLSTEAAQQQVAILKAQMQATTQLSADMRQALLQLTETIEQRLMLSAPATTLPLPSPRPWHNLPQRSYTRFIGREEELELLQGLLHPTNRIFLVTLDGIGGVGKSALALEIAYSYRTHYEMLPSEERFEALIWVSAKRTLLTASGIQQHDQTFNTLADLYQEIATVLERPDILQAEVDQRRRLVKGALKSQRTLLIVDNLETVDDDELLSFLRDLPEPTKAIATTRHRIDIAYALRLSGMPKEDALRLVAWEAQHKGVALSLENTDALYRRTGGLPLAMVWSVALMSLGYGVESVLRRLGSGYSDIARFCFAESVAHIQGRDPYRLMLALSLFDTAVSRSMIGKVAGLKDDEIGRDDGLAELEQLSLVNKQSDRFSLLPLTGTFAAEELTQHPELAKELTKEWIDVLVALARPYAGLHWRWRDLARLRVDGRHLIPLAAWAQEQNRPNIVVQILPGLAYYYDLIGQWTGALAIGRVGIEYARLLGDIESIIFIQTYSMAAILSQQGQHAEAERLSLEALQLCKQRKDVAWMCSTLANYSQIVRRQHLYDKAYAVCQEALRLVAKLPEPQQTYAQADITFELGKIARDRGEWETARSYFHAAQQVFRTDIAEPVFNLELAWGILNNLGFVAHQMGDLVEAAKIYQQCVEQYQGIIGRSYVATLLVRFALLEEQRGNRTTALRYAREGLEWSERLGMVQEQAQARALCVRAAPSV